VVTNRLKLPGATPRTSSPTEKPFTPSPIAATVPEHSRPMGRHRGVHAHGIQNIAEI